jgi:hypothetical protein
MKNLFRTSLLSIAALGIFATASLADDRLKPNTSINELPELSVNSLAVNDYIPVYDTSAILWKKVAATTIGTAAAFEDTTATNVLLSSECGKTITLNSATEFATTLPAPTAGCSFRFIVKAAPSGASYTILTNASANILIGHVESADLNAASDGDISTADDTITITDAKAAVGDQLEIYSDGTSWYYIGHSNVFDAIIATQAS